MSYPLLDIIIGSTTLSPLQRLPSTAFTANITKIINAQRAQNGTLHTNTLYKKYNVSISGIAQTMIAQLRYEQERDDFIDLYMIVNRHERVNASGTTNTFTTSRRMRLDDDNITPTIQYPIGTTIPSTSISSLTNSTLTGTFVLTFTPTGGTQNLAIEYYPIISGIISDLTSSYDWTQDEETYNLTFQEM